jgi:hypothetical protein
VEIEHAVEIIKNFSWDCLDNIVALEVESKGSNHAKLLGNEFCKWLTILYFVTSSINSLVGEDFSQYTPPVVEGDDYFPAPPFNINAGLALVDGPLADSMRALRLEIGHALVRTGLFFKEFRESDLESLHALTKCLTNWATEFGGGLKSEVLPNTEKVSWLFTSQPVVCKHQIVDEKVWKRSRSNYPRKGSRFMSSIRRCETDLH